MAKPTASKKPRTPASAPTSLTEAERDELLDLPPDYEDLPNEPVTRRTFAQRSLVVSGRKLMGPLFEHTDLPRDALDELERRVSMLERAELAWGNARSLRANPALVAARAESEAYKRLLMRAFRYFLRHDEEVQARLSLIAHGTGDGDLVDDLRKLAQLSVRHAPRLARSQKRLGAKPAERARALAKSIETHGSDRSFDANATDALALRNRAYWHAAELESEVREAGRYAYADEPKRLDVFLRDERPSFSDAATDEAPLDEAPLDDDAEASPPAADAPAPPKGGATEAKGDAKKPAGAAKEPAKSAKQRAKKA